MKRELFEAAAKVVDANPSMADCYRVEDCISRLTGIPHISKGGNPYVRDDTGKLHRIPDAWLPNYYGVKRKRLWDELNRSLIRGHQVQDRR